MISYNYGLIKMHNIDLISFTNNLHLPTFINWDYTLNHRQPKLTLRGKGVM